MRESVIGLIFVVVISVTAFAFGYTVGRSGDATSDVACTQESHYITQPFDGGTVHDGRTTYSGDCHGLYE